MTLEETVDVVFANVTPEQAGDFATLLKQKIESSYSNDNLKIIYDQLYEAGIDIMAAICKTHPA